MLDGVQLQPAPVVTVNVPLLAAAETDALAGEIEYVHGAMFWAVVALAVLEKLELPREL